jgi:PAS domain-containing protein
MREHHHTEIQSEKFVVFSNSVRRYTDCSDDVCELVGYARNEILAMSIDELSFDAVSVPHLFERYKLERQQNGDYILRHRNGTPVLIHYKAWIFEDGCHAAVWQPAEEWEQLYLCALIETHPARLRDKVNRALTSIRKLQSSFRRGESPELRRRLSDVSATLRSLIS